MEPIVNKVAESDLQVFNLEDLWDGNEIVEFDISPWLHGGLILREKEFRQAVKDHDWSAYEKKHVAISCSTDAIVPTWAFMLVTSKLEPFAASIAMGNRQDLLRQYFSRQLDRIDFSEYEDGMIVIKGCGSDLVPIEAYVQVMHRMQEVARKIMYGEPCSTVPLWRRQ